MSAVAKRPEPLEWRVAHEKASPIPYLPSGLPLTSEPRNGPVTITLIAEPIAISRVRFVQSGRAFTPTRTRNYLGELHEAAKEAMQDRAPLDGALSVVARFEVRIPKVSRSRTNAMLLGLIKPSKRPDLDNLLKALDALNGVVWRDDAQIVELRAEKRYSKQPKVIITVKEASE